MRQKAREPMLAKTKKVRAMELSANDLPAICPHTSMPVWAGHPRVYLDIVNQIEAACPYCGTRYRLRPGTAVDDHGFGALCLHQHRKRDDAGRFAAQERDHSSRLRDAAGERSANRSLPAPSLANV